MARRSARLVVPQWAYKDLGRDIWRSLVIVVAVETVRHFLRPKDAAIASIHAAAATVRDSAR